MVWNILIELLLVSSIFIHTHLKRSTILDQVFTNELADLRLLGARSTFAPMLGQRRVVLHRVVDVGHVNDGVAERPRHVHVDLSCKYKLF